MTTPRPRTLVTGAARRVGRAIALDLARAGCDVDITYHTSPADADATLALLRAAGSNSHAHPLDLSNLDAVAHFASRFAATPLDILIHSASTYVRTPLASLTTDELLSAYRVNAAAPLLLTQAAAPQLARSTRPGGGAVVAMLDIHALGLPRPEFSAYAMSKAALAEMVRSLARELAPKIRVNGVAPGVVAWPESGHESDQAAQAAYLKRVPLARAGTPEDAASAVRFLALDAPYITGHILHVDGGRSLL